METSHTSRACVAKGKIIHIRLLGDLAVMHAGKEIALPASKRSRALLGYLIGTGTAQTRQALCDLLWDGPDDPRAELRWSLTKLRPVVDDAQIHRIDADRERVQFVSHGATIDVNEVRTLLADGVDVATVVALEQAATLLAGEFLDGLDLPACYRFHQWCMAEREAYGALRIKVMHALIHRLADEPERALTYARTLVAADPLSEPAHAALIRLLIAAGRLRDAESHCRHAESLFQRELGIMPAHELKNAARQLRDTLRQRPQAIVPEDSALKLPIHQPASIEPLAEVSVPLVGRTAERNLIDAAIASLERPGKRNMLLFVGEPGIGKTRLLETLAERAEKIGCRVLFARCFEAEIMRPYGGWIDALRALPIALVPEALRRDLGPLLPTSDAASIEQGDRTRLFAAAAELMKSLAAQQPLVLILDDLQWLDEGSSALLHYLERSADQNTRLLIASAARQGEIDDNQWTKGLVHSLARDRHLQQCLLDPLSAGDVALLLARAAPTADAEAVHRQSGGNPLFVLTLAEAKDGAAGEELSLQALTADRVERLDENSRELIAWAAATGREFRLEMLAAAMNLPETELMMRLDRLERRGLLMPTGEGHYDFAHDLVREAVYRGLSQPRRRAMHRQIARVLEAAAVNDTSLYGELVHHASQAGDAALTVRACIAAAEHCLRVFANAQAVTAAERGLSMLEKLSAGAERVAAHIALLKLRIVATAADPRTTRVPDLMQQLQKSIGEAEWMGLHSAAASGLHILSWLAQQANDIESARAATLRAEQMSRTADTATHCLQLANTGRCLLEVESDLPQARKLINTAAVQADEMNLHIIELQWGRGLLARWDGDLVFAQSAIQQAVELARLREDRWRELECLVWLATVQLECAHYDAVDLLCSEMAQVVTRMGDVKVPMADALQAIADLRRTPARDAESADALLASGVHALRELDDKSHLAYVLNHAAELALQNNKFAQAESAAAEALKAAQAVGRSTDIAVAQALLAFVACARASTPEALADFQKAHLAGISSVPLSARGQAFLARAELAMHDKKMSMMRGSRIPTPVPTKAR
ncbi:MAG: ATP-binding protein [Burkholderiaceae bacterium]